MQLKPNAILSALNKTPLLTKISLVYGQDTGLIEQCINTYINHFQNKFECEIVKLSYDQALNDTTMFYNHIGMVSMFADFKIIIINNCREGFDINLQNIIKNIKADNVFIIAQAGDVKKTSTIVKFFLKLDNAFIIPCYKQSAADLIAKTADILKRNGFNYHTDVPSFIVNSLPHDQKMIEMEIDKLMLYKMEEKFINIIDVTTMLTNTSELSLDGLCFAIGTRNYKQIEREIKRITRDELNLIIVIRVLLNYFSRILEIRQKVKQGRSVSEVINTLKPPIFFKQRENITKVANNSSIESTLALIENLLNLEVKIKRNNNVNIAIISQYLICPEIKAQA